MRHRHRRTKHLIALKRGKVEPKLPSLLQRTNTASYMRTHAVCTHVDAFLRYSRSKSKVVKNRAELWNFVGAPLVKLVSTWSPRPRATSLGKISWGYAHYRQSYKRAYVEF